MNTHDEAGDEPDERAVAVRRLDAERQDEHAENRSVEQRPELVDDLDERSEIGGVARRRTQANSPQNAVAIFETSR